MEKSFIKLFMLTMFITMTSCGGESDVVESGTYQGTISEVEPDRTEIYVETTDGNTLELYFSDETRLTRNGQTVEFSALEEGQRVEVEVENIEDRLIPISVDIQE